MTQESLTAFFGWMAVMNIAFLGVSTLIILSVRDRVAGLHGRLFGLDPAMVLHEMYSWLGTYKMVTLSLSVAPYLALRLM